MYSVSPLEDPISTPPKKAPLKIKIALVAKIMYSPFSTINTNPNVRNIRFWCVCLTMIMPAMTGGTFNRDINTKLLSNSMILTSSIFDMAP